MKYVVLTLISSFLLSTYATITETGKTFRTIAEYNTGYTGDGDYEQQEAEEWKKNAQPYLRQVCDHLEKNRSVIKKVSNGLLGKYDSDLPIVLERTKDPSAYMAFEESDQSQRPFLLQMWFYNVQFKNETRPNQEPEISTDPDLTPLMIQVPLKRLPESYEEIEELKKTLEELLLEVPSSN